MKKFFKVLTILIISLLVSCDNEPVDRTARAENVIAVDSELYQLIERVVADEDPEGLYEFTCIAFEYPFTLLIYDEDLIFFSTQTMANNHAFSAFLGALDPQFSISLSFPITSYFDTGNSVQIDTNDELKTAIDTCIEEEFFNYCNNTLPNCIWEVNYQEEGENNMYENAHFRVNSNGTINFFYNDADYLGTWTTLYIEDETHLNIHLLDDTEVGTDWNFDWLIMLNSDGDFEIFNGTETYILHKNCDDSCDDLNFEVCEGEDTEGFAEFDLDSYSDCILSFTEVEDPASVAITFHETEIDAEANINALSSPYTNITNPQTIFVRIEDIATNETTFISITIEAVTCN